MCGFPFFSTFKKSNNAHACSLSIPHIGDYTFKHLRLSKVDGSREMYGRLFEEYPGLDALLGETVFQREFMSYCCVFVKEMQTGNNSSVPPTI